MSDLTISPTGNIIGGPLIGGTVGSVLFVGTGPVLSEDNANLFWDDANNRLGIGTASPRVSVDIAPVLSSSSPTVTTQGGSTLGVSHFVSAEAVTVPTGLTELSTSDLSLNPIASHSSNSGAFGSFLTLKSAQNFTGQLRSNNNQIRVQTTGGTITSGDAIISSAVTDTGSTGAITTFRSYKSNAALSGTNAITAYIGYDSVFTASAATTITDVIMFRTISPALSGGAVVTNYTGLDILDMTAVVTTNKIGIRQRGTNLSNWFNGNCSLGQDSLPGATVDVAGRLFIAGATGLITRYNNTTTASCGVPYITGVADLTGQTALKAATTLFTPTADGMFVIKCALKVTTAATTSSVLGAVTITYTSADGSVAQSIVMNMDTAAGGSATTSILNSTTTSTLSGMLVIHAKASVAIQYQIAYTSVGATPMAYSAHLSCQAC